MTFSYFMQTLYGSIGDNFDSQIAFFKDVIGNSVIEEKHDFINNVKDSTISKWMNGKLTFKKQARTILSSPDETCFIDYLATLFQDEDQVEMFSSSLNKKDKKIKLEDVNDIAKYFYNLLGAIPEKTKEIKKKRKQQGKTKKKDDKTNNIDLTQSSLAAKLLDSSPKETMSYLNVLHNEIRMANMAINSKVPLSILKDFEYQIKTSDDSTRPVLLPKTKDAFKNHKLKYVYGFNSEEEREKFFRAIQKAGILKKWIEVHPDYIERYIDDYKDEYYVDNGLTKYVGPIKNISPELVMHLVLDNGLFKIDIDNLILKEKEIKDEHVILSNINDDNWLYIELDIDCSKYIDGIWNRNVIFNIKNKYKFNIEYLKEFQKLSILISDNNTHITLINTPTNGVFINQDIKNGKSYNNADYKEMNEMFLSFDKIIEIQRITDTIFKFDYDEYEKNKPTYDIAYACVKDESYSIDKEIDVDVLVPNENINDYIVGDKKDRSNITDYMVLFDKAIYFKEKIIELKDSTTIRKYDDKGIHHAIVKTYHIAVK